MHQTLMAHGHDASWAPPDAVVDLTDHYGIPVHLVDHPAPDLYQTAIAAGANVIACMDRRDLICSYFEGVDPGRASVRRDLLAACDAARNGTHAERDAALDALLASVRD